MAQSFLATRKVRSLPLFYRYRGGQKTRDYDQTQERYLRTGELPSSESLALESLLKKIPNQQQKAALLPALGKVNGSASFNLKKHSGRKKRLGGAGTKKKKHRLRYIARKKRR